MSSPTTALVLCQKALSNAFESMESQDYQLREPAEDRCEACKTLFESDIFGLHETQRDWPGRRQNFPRFSGLSDLRAGASICATCKYFLEVVRSDELLQSQISSGSCEIVVAPSRAPYAVRRDNSPNTKTSCRWLYRIDITVENDGITYARGGTLSILPLASSADSLFSARQVGEAADLDLAQKWLSICKSCHGESCQPADLKIPSGLQLRLVDVKRKCVVAAPLGSPYIALSYVWGDVLPLLLSNDNHVRLTTVDGLAPSQDDVPQVFLDAMNVSEAMGCQYIWIDAICIMQDDVVDRTVQIENMRLIYSCASLTIVSDSSSATDGLPCLQNRSRTTQQTLHQHRRLQLSSILPNLHYSLSYSQWRAGDSINSASGSRVTFPWESRGWTFQENLMSNRLLIFSTHQILILVLLNCHWRLFL